MQFRTISAFVFGVMLALPASAGDQEEANRLFVEATRMVERAMSSPGPQTRADLYSGALAKLERIVDEFPGSDLAVDMLAGERVGVISLPSIRNRAELTGLKAQQLERQIKGLRARLQEATDKNGALEAENKRLMSLKTPEKRAAASAADGGGLRERLSLKESQLAESKARTKHLDEQNARLWKSLWAERRRVASAPAKPAAQPAKTPVKKAAPAKTAAPAKPAKPAEPAKLSSAFVTAGLRNALSVGTGRAVSKLGRTDGFNKDAGVHVPLPDGLAKVSDALMVVGVVGVTDDLELKLNRAAEDAVSEIEGAMRYAITGLSFADANKLVQGPADGATRALREKAAASLAKAARPIVEASLERVGATKAHDTIMTQYKAIPFVPAISTDLTAHVVEKTLGGLFGYLAREESAIRSDPAMRTTPVLQRVFAAKTK
jgi:hypothetical protein